MTHWLIANTAAGDGSRNAEYWLAHLHTAGLDDVKVKDIGDTGWHAEVAPGDRALVAGGDGSVNLAAALCLERQAILGVLPSGTANDFSRNLNLPDDPEAICRIAVGESTVAVDVAWINDRLFLNVAHIGLGTMPAREASQQQKRRLGHFSYLLTVARKLAMQRGFSGRIEAQDQVAEGRWLTVALASGAFFGGGHGIAGASIDDGQLDIVAIRHRSWLRLSRAYLATLLLGRTPRGDDTMVHLRAPECRLQLRHAHTLTADGEILERTCDIASVTRHAVLKVACQEVVGADEHALAGKAQAS